MTYTVGEKAIGNPIFPISLFLALKGDSDKFTITFTNDYKSKIVGRAITTLRLMQKAMKGKVERLSTKTSAIAKLEERYLCRDQY